MSHDKLTSNRKGLLPFFVGVFYFTKMKFIEKNLEDIIFQSNRLELSKRGLNLRGKIFRQVRIGNYGTADLVTIKKPNFYSKSEWNNPYHDERFLVTIYELKQEKIGIKS